MDSLYLDFSVPCSTLSGEMLIKKCIALYSFCKAFFYIIDAFDYLRNQYETRVGSYESYRY